LSKRPLGDGIDYLDRCGGSGNIPEGEKAFLKKKCNLWIIGRNSKWDWQPVTEGEE
jgi:hypothetical protein